MPEADAVLVIGSKNSSNSTRLAEIAAEYTGRAYLIDSVAEIDPGWFSSHDTVLITAGASAPENLVQECVAYLRQTFQAEVEHHSIREENVEFLLPVEVR